MKSGAPPFSEGQRAEILAMLKAAGPSGVSKAELVFEKHMTQASARVFELETMGFQIAHVHRDGEKYVRFVLESEPLELKSLDASDWYERTTGNSRVREPSQKVADLPLFSERRA